LVASRSVASTVRLPSADPVDHASKLQAQLGLPAIWGEFMSTTSLIKSRIAIVALIATLFAAVSAPAVEPVGGPCISCNGRGRTSCMSCQGTGRGMKCFQCDGTGSRLKSCSYCNGSGRAPGGNMQCFTCRGTGAKIERCISCSGAGSSQCFSCRGVGIKSCTMCNGSGRSPYGQ